MVVRQNQGVWWVFSSGKGDDTDFASLTYFATSYPSNGCCAAEGNSNNSMVRNVRVLGKIMDGCEAESKGLGGVQ